MDTGMGMDSGYEKDSGNRIHRMNMMMCKHIGKHDAM